MSADDIILHHNDIIDLIPHRYPFLLVDKVRITTPGETAIGIKAITSTEPYLAGHFPGHPIIPGVLIIEAMAQTAGVMVAHSQKSDTDDEMHVYFTTIENARFRAPSRPGDLLECHVKRTGGRSTLHKFEAEAFNDGKKVASASFSAMLVEPGQ
jgi:3-hydroxyacyl-[acyl-carrier-protein] dehydratase